MKKNRGKFLTTMLVLLIFSMIVSLYYVPMMNLNQFYTVVPSWFSPFLMINAFVDIAALIGIWLWKKVAVYVYAASSILGVLMEILILKPNVESVGNSISGVALFGLLFWAVSRKWSYFK